MAVSDQHRIRIAVIGCGFMGSAILQSLLVGQDKQEPQYSFAAHVKSSESLDRLKQDFSAHFDRVSFSFGDDKLAETAASADVILLGFLPGDLGTILGKTGVAQSFKGKLVISMLAGVPISQIQDVLDNSRKDGVSVGRVIPTLGAKIGESVTLVAVPDESSQTEQHKQMVDGVFSRVGVLQHIPERLMNSATAIGAAVHALTIVAVDSVTDASVAEGLPRAAASALATQSLRSAAGLLSIGGMTPESLKMAMSTPAGITLNSLVQLDAEARGGIAKSVRGAVRYANGMNG